MIKIKVKVYPNTKVQKVSFITEANIYKVHLHSQPIKGKANKELIQLLSNYFKKNSSNINIISGTNSDLKTIVIDN